MKSREDLLRGAVGKLRPESSLREKVLSGARGRRGGRPAVRRFSLVGVACLAVLAVAILLPGLLDLSVEPVTGPGAQTDGTPSLSVEQGEDTENALTQSVLIGVANDGQYLDAVAVATLDPLEKRVACLFLSASCMVDTTDNGTVSIGELYRLGGVESFETGVENLLDLAVDGTVIVSYDSLPSFFDAQDGVSVYLLDNEAQYLNECNQALYGTQTDYMAGPSRLNGQEAVWFLLFSGDGENQLTSRSGRRVALAESLWEEADAEKISAGLSELFSNALVSTLPEVPDKSAVESLLSCRFACTAFPDDSMSVDPACDGEGWEMRIEDLPSLQKKAKAFLFEEETQDVLSTAYLPPYENGGRTELQRAVDNVFLDLAGMQREERLELTVPAVQIYSADLGPDTQQVDCVAFGLCTRFRLDGTVLREEDWSLLGARLVLEENADGAYELQSVDQYLESNLAEFGSEESYLSLAEGDETLAWQIYHQAVELDGIPYWDTLDSALMEYRSYYGLDDTLLSYEMEGLPISLTDDSPMESVLDAFGDSRILVESGDGVSFFSERGEELSSILRDQDWVFEGRIPSLSQTGLSIALLDADGSVKHRLLFSTDDVLIVDFAYRYEIPQSLYDSDFYLILAAEWETSPGIESAAG